MSRELSLTLHPDKTDIISVSGSNQKTIQYLGYSVTFGAGAISIKISKTRFERYKTRICLSFEKYLKDSRLDEKKARKLLIKRIRYLTSNTRLLNSKRNAFVGVYFSNSLINNTKQLVTLDTILLQKISSINVASLSRRLARYSFLKGFETRTFSAFSSSELSQIVKVWENA